MQGDPYALFNFGYMHMRGIHPAPQDYSLVRHYFEQAALRGLPAGWNGGCSKLGHASHACVLGSGAEVGFVHASSVFTGAM